MRRAAAATSPTHRRLPAPDDRRAREDRHGSRGVPRFDRACSRPWLLLSLRRRIRLIWAEVNRIR